MISDNNIRQPLVFKITGNSINDGSGIRSVIFLKGCPLKCVWCHNPESQKVEAELWWDKDKCIGCYDCVQVCPNDAIEINNPAFINRNKCSSCFKCIEVCPSTALSLSGKSMSVDEIVRNIIEYKPFFDISGGGVTISGGEPTMFMDFTSELLKKLKKEKIHTLLETSGYFNLEKFKSLCLPYIDELYMDIKILDPSEHLRLCGVRNEIILKNFIWLHQNYSTLEFKFSPRVPLIPGLTDTMENISGIISFFKKQKVKKATLLLNNPLWFNKNSSLGRKEKFKNGDTIRKFYKCETSKKIKNCFISNGIDVCIE